MKSLATAQSLRSVGRFREALASIPSSDARQESLATRLLRAELISEMGDAAGASSILQGVETVRGLTETERGLIELVKANIEKENGNFDSELHHLQKSASFAERGHDLDAVCQLQLRLVALIADRSGPEPPSGR